MAKQAKKQGESYLYLYRLTVPAVDLESRMILDAAQSADSVVMT